MMIGSKTAIVAFVLLFIACGVAIKVTVSALDNLQRCEVVGVPFSEVYTIILKGC